MFSFFFSSRRRHTSCYRDWSSDVCSSDLPFRSPTAMKRLLRYFVQGLVITVPTLVTGYVCYVAFVTLDGWLRLPVPGAGFVITIVAITLIGAFGSSLITRSLIAALDSRSEEHTSELQSP